MSLPPTGREILPYEPDAAIRVGMSAREQIETRWGLILVIFMRLLAALWILQGLSEWASFMVPHTAIFDHMTKSQTAAIMFFAVIDFLAAVGLWLATPWGGVLWLFAEVAQILIALGVKNSFSAAWVACDVALIALYFSLTWQAARAAQRF